MFLLEDERTKAEKPATPSDAYDYPVPCGMCPRREPVVLDTLSQERRVTSSRKCQRESRHCFAACIDRIGAGPEGRVSRRGEGLRVAGPHFPRVPRGIYPRRAGVP